MSDIIGFVNHEHADGGKISKSIDATSQAEHDKEVATLQTSAAAARDAAQEELSRLAAELAERETQMAAAAEEAASVLTRATDAEAALCMPFMRHSRC